MNFEEAKDKLKKEKVMSGIWNVNMNQEKLKAKV
jgi:hypothetical protein